MLMATGKSHSDTSSESVDLYRERMISLRVLYFTVFLGNIGFSIVMPSIWPYLQVLTKEATTSFLGVVVGSFCLGQLVMSPPLGYMSNRMQKSKIPIVIGLAFQVSGNFMWAYLQDLPRLNGYSMVIARFFTGIGSANMAVIRSYVSKATTLKERTGVNAIIAACMALGFCIGPGVQAAMVGLGYPGVIETQAFRLNVYTGPGWVGIILGIINILSIIFIFRECDVPDDPVTEAQINAEVYYNEVSSTSTLTGENDSATGTKLSLDYVIVVVLLIAFFVLFFLFTMVETMTTPLSMYELAWSKSEATLYGGIIWTSSGILSILVVLLLRGPLARFSERRLMMGGYVFILIAFLVYIPYTGETPKISWVNNTFGNSTDGGCPSTLAWCFTEPKMHLYQLLGGTFFLTLGFPVVNLLVSTLYSKVLGPVPQGLWMGIFTASGGLARILGSVFVGASLERLGPRITMITVAVMTALMWAGTILVYPRIVPYAVRLERLLEANKSESNDM